MAGQPLRRSARELSGTARRTSTRFVRRESEHEEGIHFVDDFGGGGGAKRLHVQQWNEGGDGDNESATYDSSADEPTADKSATYEPSTNEPAAHESTATGDADSHTPDESGSRADPSSGDGNNESDSGHVGDTACFDAD